MNTGCSHSAPGFIGTYPDSIPYEPTDDESVFFVNMAGSAEADGDVTNLSYCYSLEGGAKVKFYQATVGVAISLEGRHMELNLLLQCHEEWHLTNTP